MRAKREERQEEKEERGGGGVEERWGDLQRTAGIYLLRYAKAAKGPYKSLSHSPSFTL